VGKITLAEAFLFDVPVAAERTDAVQAFLKQETVLVHLATDDGLEGRGYSYTIGTGGTAVLEMLRGYLLPKALGADSACPEALWEHLRRSTLATMVGPITTLALAAVDTAAWDLRARAFGLPLWQLAGGAQESVPLYDTEGGWLHLGIAELAENAVAAVERGFGGVKVKIGKPQAADDVARIAAVREAVGPHVALMVDANQGLTRDDALRRARLLEPYDLTWIEEPLPADDVEGHALLARSTTTPIAVGETLYSLGQFREYLARGAASVVQPDVARIGGVTPWLKVAHLAEAFDVPVAPHFLMELHVSLAAAVTNGRWVEWIPQLESVTTSQITRTGGRAVPPGSAGLGVDWDDAALERCRAGGPPGAGA
jgi:L-alanine-DL-glutamate epimerase-like enolase superfamily enzyme